LDILASAFLDTMTQAGGRSVPLAIDLTLGRILSKSKPPCLRGVNFKEPDNIRMLMMENMRFHPPVTVLPTWVLKKESRTYRVISKAHVFASVDSWDTIGEKEQGEEVLVTGLPKAANGYVMVPIAPEGAMDKGALAAKEEDDPEWKHELICLDRACADPEVFPEPDEFRLDRWQDRNSSCSMAWGDFAYVEGRKEHPHSHGCPGKELSINMTVAFVMAYNEAGPWELDTQDVKFNFYGTKGFKCTKGKVQ